MLATISAWHRCTKFVHLIHVNIDRRHKNNVALVELTMFRSGMKCFADAGRAPLDALRERLMLNVPDAVLNEHVRRLVMKAYDNLGTRAYDSFQWHSNGIEA